MKKVFYILLLTNSIFFGLIHLGWPGWGSKIQMEQAPLNAEKIHLLDTMKKESIETSGGMEQKPPTVLASPPATRKPVDSLAAAVEKNQISSICMEWGDFSGSNLERATAALSDLKVENKLTRREIEHDTGYWIYMGPLRNKRAVNKKIGELKDLGITEHFVITTGRWKNSISLGVFRTEESAQNFFTDLKKQGVRTAKIGERASKYNTTIFRLDDINEEIRGKLLEIQESFAGSKLDDVACALTR